MTTRMSATEARVHFGEILRRVEDNETITVERAGHPKAVILSIQEYETLKANGKPATSCEDRLMRTRERYLREAADVQYDVEENLHQIREERGDDLIDSLR